MNVRGWMTALRGIIAAAGLALLTLGAVLLMWPRPGGIVAVVAGAALFALAGYLHHRVTQAVDDKLRLGP
jgi:hypothetical protein